MKKLFTTLFSAVFVAVLSVGFVFAAIPTGKMAPDFSLEDTNGKMHTLSSYKGKVVVLEWLNHDCPFVKKHYGSNNMQSLQKKYGAKNVVWLSVNSSAHGKQGHYHPPEANQLTKAKGASPSAVLLDVDGIVGRAYGAKTTPHMFVINQDGSIAYQGAIDSIPSANPGDVKKGTNYVQSALDAVLGGKAVEVATTVPYGCSVKY